MDVKFIITIWANKNEKKNYDNFQWLHWSRYKIKVIGSPSNFFYRIKIYNRKRLFNIFDGLI